MERKRKKVLKKSYILIALMLCLVGWGDAIPQVRAQSIYDRVDSIYWNDELYDMLAEESVSIERDGFSFINPIKSDVVRIHVEPEPEVLRNDYLLDEITIHVEPEPEILSRDYSPVEITIHVEPEDSRNTHNCRVIDTFSTTSVTITHVGNGHTGGTVPASHTINTPGLFTIRQPGTMVRTNHHFTGWRNPVTNQTFLPGQIVNITGHGTIRLYAQWQRNVVTITYVGNGHTGGTVPGGHIVSTPGQFTVRGPETMVRTNHHLTGWRNPATGQIFLPGQVFNVTGHGSMRLYAQWQRNTVRVTYHSNGHSGGSPPPGHTINTPGTFVVNPQGIMFRTNHHFTGWRISISGQIVWPGQVVEVTGHGSLRLDAVWTPSVRLTFNPNGGTVSPTFADVPQGFAVFNLPTPTRTNRYFVDWFTTSATTGGTRFRNGMTIPNVNTTYWARWNDPNRHINMWWQPANSGTTIINYRVINNPNATWDGRMRTGAILWNDSSARVNFTRNNASSNTVSLTTDGDSRIYLYNIGTTNVLRFRALLCTNQVARFVDETGFTTAHVAHTIMAHEFGHAIGLRDNPVLGGQQSVMTQGAFRPPSEPIITTFDITSVNMIY